MHRKSYDCLVALFYRKHKHKSMFICCSCEDFWFQANFKIARMIDRRLFLIPVSTHSGIIRSLGSKKWFCVLYFQCPEAIIELYNSVLDHLGAVASSNSLQRLSWPISEFTDNEKNDHGMKRSFYLELCMFKRAISRKSVGNLWSTENGFVFCCEAVLERCTSEKRSENVEMVTRHVLPLMNSSSVCYNESRFDFQRALCLTSVNSCLRQVCQMWRGTATIIFKDFTTVLQS